MKLLVPGFTLLGISSFVLNLTDCHADTLNQMESRIAIENEHFSAFLDAAKAARDSHDVMGGDYLVDPPKADFGYWATPANSLTFLAMGVDGVHTAMLTLGGRVTNDSPVIYVSPMDSDSLIVLAPTFLGYLADGCAVSVNEMAERLTSAKKDPSGFMAYLDEHFDVGRMLEGSRTAELNDKYLSLVVIKPDSTHLFPSRAP